MAKLPFMQFYPADWIQDTQTISTLACGVWIKLLCQMWIAPSRGVVELSEHQLKVLTGIQLDEQIEAIIAELDVVADIEQVESGGKIDFWRFTSRRMVRDEVK